MFKIKLLCAVLFLIGIMMISCDNSDMYENKTGVSDNTVIAQLQSVTPVLTEYENAYTVKKICEIYHHDFLDAIGADYDFAFPYRCLAVWNGEIYVAFEDTDCCRVLVTDSNGAAAGELRLSWEDEISFFSGFTMDGGGRFYVNAGTAVYIFNHDGTPETKLEYNGIKSANAIKYSTGNIAVDTEGNICLYSEFGLISLDAEGNLLFSREMDIGDVMFDKEDILIAKYTTGYSNPPIFLRPDSSGTPLKVPAPVPPDCVTIENGSYRLFLCGKNPYFANETGLYASDSANGPLCGWQDSAMMFNEFREFIVISRERIVCLVPNRLSDGAYDVFLLSAPEEGKKIARYEITVALTANNYKLELAASYFNRLNDKYRIVISDYSEYNTLNDSMAGRDRLDRDLTTGAVPDIMAIDPKMDWRRYVSKGMFIDLYQLMDSDEDFNRSSILGMLLNLCEYREGLYYLPDSFIINTLITHGSSGKTSFTLSDAVTALNELDGDERLFAKSFTNPYQHSNGIIMPDESFLWPAACSFIDFDSASCDLDNIEFVEYLVFMKALYDADAALIKSGKYDDEWQENLSAKALSGEIIYNPYSIGCDYPGANVLAYLAYCYDNSYNITGYPSDGKNGSLIELGNMFAVSKNANSVEGAWSFLKYYFGDEYLNMEIQSGNGIFYNYYPFPATVSAFNAELEQSLNSVYTVNEIFEGMDPVSAHIAYDEYPDDVTEYKNVYTISDEAVETLTDFVSSAEVIPLKNSFIINILKEELISCFTGSTSAQTAAERMQNRVSIYLSEQS